MERTGGTGVYGMPEPRGFKLGWARSTRSRSGSRRRCGRYDRESERALVERVREDFPGFDPTPVASEAGPFTLVPDETFVLRATGRSWSAPPASGTPSSSRP